jgi:hypothetical protein
MFKVKLILGLGLLAVVVSTTWQLVTCELDAAEFRDELRDIAAQKGAKIGWVEYSSDPTLRKWVIDQAFRHDIELDPEQVSITRTGDGAEQTVYLAVDYQVPIKVPWYTFILYFHPSSSDRSGLHN